MRPQEHGVFWWLNHNGGIGIALRIRKDGRILCAAMHPGKEGDTYLHDGISYILTVEERVIVTEPIEKHKKHGQWWWKGNVPDDVEIEQW